MRKQIHMINRKGVFYFRRRVPEDLLPHYAPQTEFKFSLKTRDYAEADRLQRIESVKLDEEFARIRKGQTAPELHTISQDVIKSLSDLWIAHVLEEDEEWRMDGLSESEYDKLSESLEIVETGGKAALARGNTSLIEFEMEDFCESQGFKIAKGSEAHRQLCYAFLRASVQANQQQTLRHQGEVIDTPVAPKVAPPAQPVPHEAETFEALRDYWFMQSSKSQSALRIANTAIKKFRDMVGDFKPSDVTKVNAIAFKDALLSKGAAPATINKDMGILKAIFSTAEANSKLPSNPFKGGKDLPIPEKEVESPYTLEELKLIFNSPVFKDGYRPKQCMGEAAFWLPLIGLYTGCRLNEGAQLFTEDVSEQEGIPYFLIKPDAATGRSVKDGKKRRVPIHPDLVKMGLLDYVAKMKQQGHVQLFPELKVTRVNGKLGDNWGRWWCSYVRKDLGISRIPQPFHGLRHTFVEYGRTSSMSEYHREIIEGHTPANVAFRSYGGKLYPLKPLYEEIVKLEFKGLDLSHLRK
ncbi:site-specific integrase [Methylophilus sp. 5]|uniref:site-specific integrase n=1 Tax=Methylophilus sp. 5 TaxID=1112274 RepID=UPI00048A44DF|nr:site-specific integrase [Methylophilus sp. 5]